jgi:hypothetical protein
VPMQARSRSRLGFCFPCSRHMRTDRIVESLGRLYDSHIRTSRFSASMPCSPLFCSHVQLEVVCRQRLVHVELRSTVSVGDFI